MKNQLIYLTFVLLLMVVLGLLSAGVAYSLDSAVDANTCQQIKTRLKQIKLSDAVTRVNYGQVYESLSVNVMMPVNLRLVANNFKPVELLTITDQYQRQFAQFRQHYINYEEKISQTLELPCEQNNSHLLIELRQLRQLHQKLHNDTEALRQLAVNYQNRFKDLYVQSKEY